MIPYERALELTNVFLSTEYDGGRHERRVEMLDKLL
jgi:ribose 5-phosphate isomerase RpiB